MDSLVTNRNFEISAVENANYISESNGYKKLDLTDSQKMHISAFVNQLPALGAAEALSNATIYRLEFPKGIEGTLMPLKDGGHAAIMQGADGKINAVGSLFEVNTALAATTLQVFNIMSIASSQYFLAEINSKLDKINKSIEKILGFLYGDKKAELLSEISFTKYAYENYISIAFHEAQRIATISSLQQSKKVAMKDIEFYINDLDSAINEKDNTKIAALMENVFGIKDSLELSIQLYVMSSLLEVYYSQNTDVGYISNLESEMSVYLSKCDNQMLGSLSVLGDYIQSYKPKPLEKLDKNYWLKKTTSVVELMKGGEESEIKKNIHSTLFAFQKEKHYCLDKDGNVYFKKS